MVRLAPLQGAIGSSLARSVPRSRPGNSEAADFPDEGCSSCRARRPAPRTSCPMRSACSIPSAPPLVEKTVSSPAGATSEINRAVSGERLRRAGVVVHSSCARSTIPAPCASPPPPPSSLGLVERLLADAESRVLRRGQHADVIDLESDVREWIANWNEDPHPDVWGTTVDEILDRLAGYLAAPDPRTADPGHRGSSGCPPAGRPSRPHRPPAGCPVRRPRAHSLTLPLDRPLCQNRCSTTNATTSGMTLTAEPVMTVENSACEPPPAALAACCWASPTVRG